MMGRYAQTESLSAMGAWVFVSFSFTKSCNTSRDGDESVSLPPRGEENDGHGPRQ